MVLTNFQIFSMKTTKVKYYFNVELLNAKLPIGEGASKTELAAKVTSNMRTGGTPANWRSKASSIKDQGSCGSCWAFTTVGLYETLMKVKGKQEYDLS